MRKERGEREIRSLLHIPSERHTRAFHWYPKGRKHSFRPLGCPICLRIALVIHTFNSIDRIRTRRSGNRCMRGMDGWSTFQKVNAVVVGHRDKRDQVRGYHLQITAVHLKERDTCVTHRNKDIVGNSQYSSIILNTSCSFGSTWAEQ